MRYEREREVCYGTSAYVVAVHVGSQTMILILLIDLRMSSLLSFFILVLFSSLELYIVLHRTCCSVLYCTSIHPIEHFFRVKRINRLKITSTDSSRFLTNQPTSQQTRRSFDDVAHQRWSEVTISEPSRCD